MVAAGKGFSAWCFGLYALNVGRDHLIHLRQKFFGVVGYAPYNRGAVLGGQVYFNVAGGLPVHGQVALRHEFAELFFLILVEFALKLYPT